MSFTSQQVWNLSYTEPRRNGDPVRIEAHVTSQKGKGKKKAEEEDGAVEGIVYRVSVVWASRLPPECKYILFSPISQA